MHSNGSLLYIYVVETIRHTGVPENLYACIESILSRIKEVLDCLRGPW